MSIPKSVEDPELILRDSGIGRIFSKSKYLTSPSSSII